MRLRRQDPRFAQHAARRRRFAVLVLLSVAIGLVLAVVHGCQQRGADSSGAVIPAAAPPPPPPQKIHLAAVGDIMLDRGVWRRIRENGVHHVMADVRDRLRAADITFANLECPLSTAQGHAQPGGELVFCADPNTVQALLDGGIDIVAVANNHGLDAGDRGAYDTMSVLEEHGIAYAGGRPEGMEPDEITYLQAGDTTVAFLAYTDLDFWHGSMCRVDEDMENALARVREAASNADLVCVSYHWGVEYEKIPTARQQELGRRSIDAGADVILGHHPHVMSGVERYRDGVILYSMGNFVFDQRDAPDGRMNSAIFHLYITLGKRIDLAITPLRIPNPEFAPRAPTDEQAAGILAELAELSSDLGTDLEIEGQKARATFDLASSGAVAVAPATHSG